MIVIMMMIVINVKTVMMAIVMRIIVMNVVIMLSKINDLGDNCNDDGDSNQRD